MKAKLLIWAGLLLASTSAFAGVHWSVGIGVGGYYPPPPVAVYAPPPPPPVYYVPPAPGPGYAWVSGYYYPVGPRYVWHGGYGPGRRIGALIGLLHGITATGIT